MGMILPSADRHFAGVKVYQKIVREIAYSAVRKWDLAVDIGAHVGFFARPFSEKFKRVECFEPQADNARCLRENVPTAIIHEVALGAYPGIGELVNPVPTNSGAWEVVGGIGTIPVRTLDSFDLAPDLVKIDVQGSTVAVLTGARGTLERHRPVVIMEAWRHGGADKEALELLAEMGARVFGLLNKDVVMTWRDT